MKCRIAVILVLLSLAQIFSQNAVNFHVTSIAQNDAKDYCTTANCSATRFVVEGYTRSKDGGVEYILECVEVTGVTCARLHAHAEYSARIFERSVAFGPIHRSTTPPAEIDYDIKSEREIKSKRK